MAVAIPATLSSLASRCSCRRKRRILAPQLKILSPGEESYVSGPTLLRASVVPADSVASVTFFVDGRQVCALTRPPFECDWDAGPAIGEHQVRAVADARRRRPRRADGPHQGRRVTENVNVDVVQVTVTVSDGHGRFVRDLPQSAFHVPRTASRRGSRTSRRRTCRSR